MNYFSQNKPNLPDTKINVTSVTIKNYEEIRLPNPRKNKPKTNPNKPNYLARSFHPQGCYRPKAASIRVVGLKFPWLLEEFDFGLSLLLAEQLFELDSFYPFNVSVQPHHDVTFSNEELIIFACVS